MYYSQCCCQGWINFPILFSCPGIIQPITPLPGYVNEIAGTEKIYLIPNQYFKFQAEMMGFQCLDPQFPDLYYHIYPIINASIFNIQRGNFNEFKDGIMGSSAYDPPPLELYTKFFLPTYFFVFWVILLLQSLCILLVDKLFVKSTPNNITFWKRFIHACQKSHFPFPYENWHEAEGTCLDHVKRKNAAQLEVLLSIAVNLVFNMILLFPLIILCKIS